MQTTEPSDKNEIREVIDQFIAERLRAKLDKLEAHQTEQRTELAARYERDVWLADAARRAAWIQLATHILKPQHPSACGTEIYEERLATSERPRGLVGTFCLGAERSDDVVGNAAALDVYKFLSLRVGELSLLDMARTEDSTFLAVLSDDAVTAAALCRAFSSVATSASSPASHRLARQVYFPLPTAGFHLLAPLFPTSLVHRAQTIMREDRFGEPAQAARAARKSGTSSAQGYREYPNLAIRKLGGTKPQNISQLNSERHGENWLLPSLPPIWRTVKTRPPWRIESVFQFSFGRQKRVRDLTRELREFLQTVAHNNLAIRRRRASLVEQICDEVLLYAERLRELPTGWSADAECRLHEVERLWLDPLRAQHDEEFRLQRLRGDWPAQVCHRFGNWLSSALSTRQLAFGDAEHAHWSGALSNELSMFREVLEDNRD